MFGRIVVPSCCRVNLSKYNSFWALEFMKMEVL